MIIESAGVWAVCTATLLLAHWWIGWYASVGAAIGAGIALGVIAMLRWKHIGSRGAAFLLLSVGLLVGLWLGALQGVHA